MKDKLLKQKAELELWLEQHTDHSSVAKHLERVTKSVELKEINEKLVSYEN